MRRRAQELSNRLDEEPGSAVGSGAEPEVAAKPEEDKHEEAQPEHHEEEAPEPPNVFERFAGLDTHYDRENGVHVVDRLPLRYIPGNPILTEEQADMVADLLKNTNLPSVLPKDQSKNQRDYTQGLLNILQESLDKYDKDNPNEHPWAYDVARQRLAEGFDWETNNVPVNQINMWREDAGLPKMHGKETAGVAYRGNPRRLDLIRQDRERFRKGAAEAARDRDRKTFEEIFAKMLALEHAFKNVKSRLAPAKAAPAKSTGAKRKRYTSSDLHKLNTNLRKLAGGQGLLDPDWKKELEDDKLWLSEGWSDDYSDYSSDEAPKKRAKPKGMTAVQRVRANKDSLLRELEDTRSGSSSRSSSRAPSRSSLRRSTSVRRKK
jgi:hypothetical protein